MPKSPKRGKRVYVAEFEVVTPSILFEKCMKLEITHCGHKLRLKKIKIRMVNQ